MSRVAALRSLQHHASHADGADRAAACRGAAVAGLARRRPARGSAASASAWRRSTAPSRGFLTSGLRVVVAGRHARSPRRRASRPSSAGRGRPGTAAPARRAARVAILPWPRSYVGYEDGRFLYAGRPETLSIGQRLEFDAPDAASSHAHDRGRGRGAARDLVVRDAGRQPQPDADAACSTTIRARGPGTSTRSRAKGAGADRALQLRPGQCASACRPACRSGRAA